MTETTAPLDLRAPTGAIFSECRTYRYALWRRWGEGAAALFIGLNPSTADEARDDPTIRRCIRFARDWGHDAVVVVNLFAYRATDPRNLIGLADPIGPDNDLALAQCHDVAAITVAAWGVNGRLNDRADAVMRWLDPIGKPLHCLGTTKDGHPRHPLYVPANRQPSVYRYGDL